MKSKQRVCFREGNPKPLKFSGFKTCNSFPFNKPPKKNRSVLSGFQASEPAALINWGAIEWEAMKFSVREQ
jgi:hypothetical protein